MQHDVITLMNALYKYKKTTISFLCEVNNITRRQFIYRLEKINDLLIDNKIPQILLKDDNLDIDTKALDFISNYLYSIRFYDYYEYSNQERLAIIFILILLQKDFIDLSTFVLVIKASKSTINNSLKELKYSLKEDGLDISFSRNGGYQLIGSELDVRNYFMKMVSLLIQSEERPICLDRIIELYHLDTYDYIYLIVEELANKYHIQYVGDRISELIYNLIFLKQRMLCNDIQQYLLNGQETKISVHMKEYLFANELFSILNITTNNIGHIQYVCAWMLSISIGNYDEYSSDRLFLSEIIQKVMDRFELLSACVYENKDDIFRQLYAHFRPAYYRMIFNIPINNPLKDKIKKEYENLYSIVKASLKPLDDFFGHKLNDDEISFFTMHFALIYNKEKYIKKINKPKAVVVCNNGIAGSVMLYQELTMLLPQLEILKPIDFYTFKNQLPNVDIVFTTQSLFNYLKINKPVISVNVVMDDTEKLRIIQEVDYLLQEYAMGGTSIIDRLLSKIAQHTIIQDEKNLRKDIFNVLYHRPINQQVDDNVLTLKDILLEDNIIFSSKQMNSEEAVRLSLKPLYLQDFIDKEYEKQLLVNNMEYYVIAPGIAFPHVNLPSAVHKVGLSLLVLENPVSFGYHDDIKYIFTLCAIDQTSHMLAMKQLLAVWNNDDFFKLLENKDATAVYKYILNFIDN